MAWAFCSLALATRAMNDLNRVALVLFVLGFLLLVYASGFLEEQKTNLSSWNALSSQSRVVFAARVQSITYTERFAVLSLRDDSSRATAYVFDLNRVFFLSKGDLATFHAVVDETDRGKFLRVISAEPFLHD